MSKARLQQPLGDDYRSLSYDTPSLPFAPHATDGVSLLHGVAPHSMGNAYPGHDPLEFPHPFQCHLHYRRVIVFADMAPEMSAVLHGVVGLPQGSENGS